MESMAIPAPMLGLWKEQKERMIEKFKNLTEMDFEYVDGKKDEMFTKLQNKLGKTREELLATIKSL
jgi:hypothetical protein